MRLLYFAAVIGACLLVTYRYDLLPEDVDFIVGILIAIFSALFLILYHIFRERE